MTRTNETTNITEDGRDMEFLRQQARAAAIKYFDGIYDCYATPEQADR